MDRIISYYYKDHNWDHEFVSDAARDAYAMSHLCAEACTQRLAARRGDGYPIAYVIIATCVTDEPQTVQDRERRCFNQLYEYFVWSNLSNFPPKLRWMDDRRNLLASEHLKGEAEPL